MLKEILHLINLNPQSIVLVYLAVHTLVLTIAINSYNYSEAPTFWTPILDVASSFLGGIIVCIITIISSSMAYILVNNINYTEINNLHKSVLLLVISIAITFFLREKISREFLKFVIWLCILCFPCFILFYHIVQ